ncbi:MAG: GNAT family N-acetyltransferase [Dehalococcoidia bacterium]
MAVTLEPVAPADYDAFFATMRAYHAELDAYDPASAERPFDIERYRRAVLDDMEGRELLWIAEDGERAGFVMTHTLPDWPDDSRTVATVSELYVAPEHRWRGLGRAAVEELLAQHRRRGTDEVEAGILRDNAPARAFWERMGFEVRSYLTARRP